MPNRTFKINDDLALTLVTGDDMAVFGLDAPAIVLHDKYESAWGAFNNDRCWFVMLSEAPEVIDILRALIFMGRMGNDEN